MREGGHQVEDTPITSLKHDGEVSPSVNAGAHCELLCTEQLGATVTKAVLSAGGESRGGEGWTRPGELARPRSLVRSQRARGSRHAPVRCLAGTAPGPSGSSFIRCLLT